MHKQSIDFPLPDTNPRPRAKTESYYDKSGENSSVKTSHSTSSSLYKSGNNSIQYRRHIQSPLLLNESILQSKNNYLFATGDCLSPSVLLSPVLTRPIRSLSTQSTNNFIRTTSVGSGNGIINSGISDNEFECSWMESNDQSSFRSRNNSRTSHISDSNSIISNTNQSITTGNVINNANNISGSTISSGTLAQMSSGTHDATSSYPSHYSVLNPSQFYREGKLRKSICYDESIESPNNLQRESYQLSPIPGKGNSSSLSSHPNASSITSQYNISDSSETFMSRPESVAEGKYTNSLHSSFSVLNPNENIMGRSHVLASSNYTLNPIQRFTRRPSIAATSISSLQGQHYNDSHFLLESTNTPSQSCRNNMIRMRHSLGHSDPELSSIYSTKSSRSSIGSRKSTVSIMSSFSGNGILSRTKKERRSTGLCNYNNQCHDSLMSKTNKNIAYKKSVDTNQSIVPIARCKSPVNRVKLRNAIGRESLRSHINPVIAKHSVTKHNNPNLPPHVNLAEHRRWSLASLPSTSGYGTPGSSSALSSQYSSQEQINELFNDMRIEKDKQYHCGEHSTDGNEEIHKSLFRPRSRSLSSPVCFLNENVSEVPLMSTVFKERFPKAKHYMEELLRQFIAENIPLSGTSTTIDIASLETSPGKLTSPSFSSKNSTIANDLIQHSDVSTNTCRSLNMQSLNTSHSSSINSIMSNRRSIIVSGAESITCDTNTLNCVSDGATRFIHHQIVEIASDCYQKSKDDGLSSNYFLEMTCKLDELLVEGQHKVSDECFNYLSKIVKELLMIISRPARLLECLEFDPDDFYKLLQETEGALRQQLVQTNKKPRDLPQYILEKLGLDKGLNSSPLEERFSKNSSVDTELYNNLEKSSTTSSIDSKPKGIQPYESDFETIRLISNGAYGAVYLVRHKITRQRFALKKMKKQTLILRNQVDQVYAERDILTFTDNPFVVSFFGSFETKTYLCMLLEYVEGGDCASLLKIAGVLPLELTRLYSAETVLAIEYLHSYGIVHRDLKPDNLLITAMGHIKLTDFGLSKIGLMNRTTLASESTVDDIHQFKDMQLCGTPDYIAPEVILRQGYGKPVDWWALGIIVYEFLVGVVPFCGDTPENLFASIIRDEPEFPEGEEALDPEAEDMIKMLLEKNPDERLGTFGGAVQVSSHLFFKSLDFNSLLRQKAEFVPKLQGEEDTSYFDTRSDRYNHDADSGDEETPMFLSFNTATPRHSICAIDSQHPGSSNSFSVTLPGIVNSSTSSICNTSFFNNDMNPPTKKSISVDNDGITTRDTSSNDISGHKKLTSSPSDRTFNKLDTTSRQLRTAFSSESQESLQTPSAVVLRKKFSAQRHLNSSTSSSGTNCTGCIGAGGSSSNSSLDASNFTLTESTGSALAQMCKKTSPLASPLPRLQVSAYNATSVSNNQESSNSQVQQQPDLSPVDEHYSNIKNYIDETWKGSNNQKKPHPTLLHTLRRPKSSLSGLVVSEENRGSIKKDSVDESLQVLIPTSSSSSTNQPSHSTVSSGQLSPGANSVSSVSSFDSNSPNVTTSINEGTNSNQSSSTIFLHPTISHTPTSMLGKGRIVTIHKGSRGFGFTIKSIKVFENSESNYFTIEHIINTVLQNSPAEKAGLLPNEFITHINNSSVNNITYYECMQKILSAGSCIQLRVIPMSQTSIREGTGRRDDGHMPKRLPKKNNKQQKLDKKHRKGSSLLRRLSGKRGTTDIIPGSSTQKQTFMPRSVSSQDGVALSTTTPINSSNTLHPNDEYNGRNKTNESTTISPSRSRLSSTTVMPEIPSIVKTSASIEPISPIAVKGDIPVNTVLKTEVQTTIPNKKHVIKAESTARTMINNFLGSRDKNKSQAQTSKVLSPPTELASSSVDGSSNRIRRSPNTTRRLSAAKLVVNKFLKNNLDN
uniref:non-specific serine/threonine protein kinase n=1 Tax=Parastrongyloides trichosuri TaxID=131310 RepID=A0A0N5A3N4_PARTI